MTTALELVEAHRAVRLLTTTACMALRDKPAWASHRRVDFITSRMDSYVVYTAARWRGCSLTWYCTLWHASGCVWYVACGASIFGRRCPAHWWAVDGSPCRHGSALRLPRRGRSVDGRALHLRGRRSLLDSCGPRWRHLRDIAQAVCRRPPGFVLGLLDVRAMTRVHAGGPLCQYNDHSTNDKELHVREMAA